MNTDAQEIVAALWAEALGEPVDSPTTSFFEMGGDSLLATEVVLRCRKVFGVDIPLDSLFDYATVGEFTARIMELQANASPAVAVPFRPLSRARPLALSFPQQRLWISQKLNPSSALFNVPLALRFHGALNVQILRTALQRIVDRHEILRTSFRENDGSVEQVIQPQVEIDLKQHMVALHSGESHEDALRRLAQHECGRPFDLTRELPMHVTLLRASDNDHLLVIVIHHIATDGSSGNVIIRELCRLYEAISADRPADLPELPIQYADYAAWQREMLQGEKLEGLLSYWRKQLAGAPDLIGLPNDFERPAAPAFSGRHLTLLIPQALSDPLKTLCVQQGCTLFMLLCAAFMLLMSRYTEQDDLLIGTDVANRTATELKDLIGFFMNVLPLRARIVGDPTFLELLGDVRSTALGAFAHQELPFDKMVEDIGPGRSAGRNPLVQVIFVMQNREQPVLCVPGLQVELFPVPLRHSRFDLGVFAQDSLDGVWLTWRYNDEIFADQRVDKMMEEYLQLLKSIAESPDNRVSALQHHSAQGLLHQVKGPHVETQGQRIKVARRRAAQL